MCVHVSNYRDKTSSGAPQLDTMGFSQRNAASDSHSGHVQNTNMQKPEDAETAEPPRPPCSYSKTQVNSLGAKGKEVARGYNHGKSAFRKLSVIVNDDQQDATILAYLFIYS